MVEVFMNLFQWKFSIDDIEEGICTGNEWF